MKLVLLPSLILTSSQYSIEIATLYETYNFELRTDIPMKLLLACPDLKFYTLLPLFDSLKLH